MSSILAAIRFALFVIVTLSLYSIWWIGSWAVSRAEWRKKMFRGWSYSFAKIAGIRLKVIGKPPEPPYFLVSNHLSYVDIPVLSLAANGVFVAKSEIRDWPLAGPIVRDMGAVFIDRTNRRDIPRAGTEIIGRLENREGVIVFPEGTSTKGEDVLPLNSSFLEFASRSSLQVSYATITYETPPGGPTPSESVCWWEDISFGRHLFRLFKLPGFTAVVTFGGETVRDPNRKVLALELRERMLENFSPMD